MQFLANSHEHINEVLYLELKCNTKLFKIYFLSYAQQIILFTNSRKVYNIYSLFMLYSLYTFNDCTSEMIIFPYFFENK